MTVETQTNIVIYNGDGVATTFDFEFPVYDISHIFVYRQVISSGEIEYEYSPVEVTVAGIGDENGGSVTILGTPVDNTRKIIIARLLPLQQLLDVLNQGGFYPQNVEQEFDLEE